MELVTLELEQELSFLESFSPGLERHPLSAIPYDHSARAVIAGRNYSLEITVLERVIFDSYCKSLVVLVIRRSFRHGPRSQHAVHFEAQIEMQARRRMLVNDEETAGSWRYSTDGLGGAVGGPFRSVRA